MDLNEAMEDHDEEGHQCIGCLEQELKGKLKDLIGEYIDETTPTHIVGILKTITDDLSTYINIQEMEESKEVVNEEEDEE